MKKQLLLILISIFIVHIASAQLGVGTETPSRSAQLDVVSADRGILIPRVELVSTTDQSTIRNGNVNSLMVFNTQTINDITPGYYYWYENKWYKIAATSDILDELIVTTLIGLGDGQFIYTSEDGTETLIDIPASVIENIINEGGIYTEIISLIEEKETVTVIEDNGDGTYTYYNENEIDADGAIIGIGVTIDVAGVVLTNIQSQGAIYNEIINILNAESDLFVDNGDGTFTHTRVDGDVVTFDANTTTMVDNGNGTYVFTNANGDTITVDVVGDVLDNITNQGDIYDEILSLMDLNETVTTLVDNGNGTFTYYNEGDYDADGNLTGAGTTFNANTTAVDAVDGVYTFKDSAGNIITAIDTNATAIAFDDSASNLGAANVQEAIDALAGTLLEGSGITLIDNDNGTFTLEAADGTDLGTITKANLTDNTDGSFTFVNVDGSAGVTFDVNTVKVVMVADVDGNIVGYEFQDANGDEIITLNMVDDIVNNIINQGAIYDQITQVIQAEESTTTLVDGKNTTVESQVTGNNTEYKVNVPTADGTNLGVVKEAAVSPTVKINEEGELSVDLSNLNAVVETAVDYTVLLSDATILGNATGGDVSITLPAATPDSKGKKFTVKKLDANEQNYIYVIGNIAGLGGQNLYTAIPYTGCDFISAGPNWHIITAF